MLWDLISFSYSRRIVQNTFIRLRTKTKERAAILLIELFIHLHKICKTSSRDREQYYIHLPIFKKYIRLCIFTVLLFNIHCALKVYHVGFCFPRIILEG